jgi:uncharacterized protein (DUF924 family)
VPDVDLRIAAVNDFWRHAGIGKWLAKEHTFVADFDLRFEAFHFTAAARQLDYWADTTGGALARTVETQQCLVDEDGSK